MVDDDRKRDGFVHWEIPDAGHNGGLTAAPRQYEQRVTRFFDSALLSE